MQVESRMVIQGMRALCVIVGKSELDGLTVEAVFQFAQTHKAVRDLGGQEQVWVLGLQGTEAGLFSEAELDFFLWELAEKKNSQKR